MTEIEFKELLTQYLTKPDYAKVKELPDGRLEVKLPDRSVFRIAVLKHTRN